MTLVKEHGALLALDHPRIATASGNVVEAIARERSLLDDRDLYAPGPSPMLRVLGQQLDRWAVSRQRVHVDSFSVWDKGRCLLAFKTDRRTRDSRNVSLHESHDPLRTHVGRAFAIGVVLNAAVVAIEAFYGWRSGSLALLGDAGPSGTERAGTDRYGRTAPFGFRRARPAFWDSTRDPAVGRSERRCEPLRGNRKLGSGLRLRPAGSSALHPLLFALHGR